MLIASPGCWAYRTALSSSFFSLHGLWPETVPLQNVSYGVQTDQRHPVIGFGQFLRNPRFAPLRMLLVRLYDLRFNYFTFPPRLAMRLPAGLFVQSLEAFLRETISPCVKCAPAHVGRLAGFRHASGFFPGLKQQSSLLHGGKTIIRSLLVHASILHLLVRYLFD